MTSARRPVLDPDARVATYLFRGLHFLWGLPERVDDLPAPSCSWMSTVGMSAEQAQWLLI